jgi:hypothetical protein
MSDLWKFMTSNYVGELIKRYGFYQVGNNGLITNEFDWMKINKFWVLSNLEGIND